LWVDEERRLSRAFVAIWAGVGEWLAREGLRETLSSVADYNAASIAAHRRLGAQVFGRVGVVRVEIGRAHV
jgi:L-amino acid N-acyltransferase YncA